MVGKLLALDQSSSNTGFCVYIDGEYDHSGNIDLHKNKDTQNRFEQMSKRIGQLIEDEKPSVVVFEQVEQISNAKTLILLARLQGIILGECIRRDIPYEILTPSSWRKAIGIKTGKGIKREELKWASIEWVKDNLCLDPEEDEAEACCIGKAAFILFEIK